MPLVRVVVLTHLASPYQTEFFDAIERSATFDLEVIYLRQTDSRRRWSAPAVAHAALYLDHSRSHFLDAERAVRAADLVVFNYYAEFSAHRLLATRSDSGAPWCFWGERPGSRGPIWFGRLLRRYLLGNLHRSRAPIWGIGRFALERYRAEFGAERHYLNLPYFSDLDRFQRRASVKRRDAETCNFLFSGALIHRKGVDLLARAFLRVAHEFPQARLRLLGDGELRGDIVKSLVSVQHQVEFLGFRDWPELPAVYQSADVLCAPSRYDGWGLVVPEGLAAGLPVISTTTTGAALEFLDRTNGWLIPPDDESGLVEAMRAAAGLHDAALSSMSQSARTGVAQHHLHHGVERFVRAAHETLELWRD
jgi:glycosyltransferase involved in cell wall biosynthesis